ncbi:MAG: hypothetical protein QOJ60_581 [Actinomycetota bacterium]|nr:hypothetical protein [Actinomycetota bacterium]
MHDATTAFARSSEHPWQHMVGAPRTGPVICHNDLSPANTIWSSDGAPVFIDWDLAAPGPPIWDLAYAAYRFVPLYDDAACERLGIPVRPRAPRLRRFVAAYGEVDLSELLDTVEGRPVSLVETARAWAEEGRPGWVDVWRDTGGRQWLGSLDHVRRERAAWLRPES